MGGKMISVSYLPSIFSMLTNSMSRDGSVRKSAESSLSQLETITGFCSCLMEVITAKELASSVDVRLSASLYFKNCINRYWSKRDDTPGIIKEEKQHLRLKLLSHLREENGQIAQMLAVLVSEIARFDYPREWPELFSFLERVARRSQPADVLTSHRIFMILFRTLKELSKKHLTADQRNFAEELSKKHLTAYQRNFTEISQISSRLFPYCFHLWQSDLQIILHGFSTITHSYNSNGVDQSPDDLYLTCERWLFCLKIICQLVISGFQSDAICIQEVRSVKEVSPVLLAAADSFLPYYAYFQNGDPKLRNFIKRACIKLMKVLYAFQQRHPYSFGDKCVLQPVLGFCLNKITDPEPDILCFEQFLIKCMVMVKSVLECKEYKPSRTGRVMDENIVTPEQKKRNISNVVAGVLSYLMPNEQIVHLCNILIRKYFVLTPNDLENWNENPERFHHEQDMVQQSEKLRPCSEALFIVLFETHSQLLAPVVVSILQEAMNGCPTSVTEISPELLLKDAAYGAVAHVYYELSNYLGFEDWFNGALSRELSNDHRNTHIIHRKIALILEWVYEIKNDTKRTVYFALIQLLQERDLSVRLAACRSLCLHVEDVRSFSEKDFSDLVPECWASCFKLVNEVKEFDSKVQVFNLISLLLGHVSEVIQYANNLMEFFHTVWEESSGESLLQIQVLITLQKFVDALGYDSPSCYDMLLPVLQKGIDMNGPDELDLLEDSMLLWEATVSNAPTMVPQLLAYFPCLLEILERDFNQLQVAINITEGYILLGGREFFNLHGSSVAKLLDRIVEVVKDSRLLSALPIIDMLIQYFPMEVPPLISCSLQKLVVICLSGRHDGDPSKTAIKASSAAILARILVMNKNYLVHFTSKPSFSSLLQQSGVSVECNILRSLVDIWLDMVDNMFLPSKKIFGIALSIILTSRMPQFRDRVDEMLRVCINLILGGTGDLTEEESRSSSKSHGKGSIKELRRQIKVSDPINQLSFEDSVKRNLLICAGIHRESFNSAVNKMHPAAYARLRQVLKMG